MFHHFDKNETSLEFWTLLLFVWHHCRVYVVFLSRPFFFESALICKDLQKNCRSEQIRKNLKPGSFSKCKTKYALMQPIQRTNQLFFLQKLGSAYSIVGWLQGHLYSDQCVPLVKRQNQNSMIDFQSSATQTVGFLSPLLAKNLSLRKITKIGFRLIALTL